MVGKTEVTVGTVGTQTRQLRYVVFLSDLYEVCFTTNTMTVIQMESGDFGEQLCLVKPTKDFIL